MTDTAPPEQILTEAANRAMEMTGLLARHASEDVAAAGAHMAYLAGLIRGGITNLAIAYDRGWDEGYDAAPTPLAAPADMAAVWQGLNDEQRAVVCVVSPELAGMLDAAEDPAPVEVTESEMGPPPYYLAQLRGALGSPVGTLDEVVEQVRKLRCMYREAGMLADRYRTRLLAALGLDERAEMNDAELLDQAVGVVTRAQRAARAWAGTGEPGEVAATALQDLVHYLDERAA